MKNGTPSKREILREFMRQEGAVIYEPSRRATLYVLDEKTQMLRCYSGVVDSEKNGLFVFNELRGNGPRDRATGTHPRKGKQA
jgi:hypothetical protein